MHKQPKHARITLAVISALVLMSGGVATAGPLTIPNSFVASTPATAASVNQNFTAVETAVDDNDARVTTNTGNIGTNTTNIGTNTGNIGTNTTNIGTNTGNIGTNTTNIGNNFSSITGNTSNITTNTSNIGTNTTDIADHETRITTLEGAGGGGASSADNPIINVDCSTDSLQAAIESAPLHGKTVINISGACSDDIFVRRSGITIQGSGPADSISGTASGFSSDPADSYNLPAAAGALVQRVLDAAVEIDGSTRVVLKDMTINAGSNASAVRAERNSSLKLDGVTLVGGAGGFGMHASDSNVNLDGATVTGDGTAAAVLFAGAALLAENNSVIELQNGNTFTGGNGDTTAFVALANTSVQLTGGSNVINAGTDGGDPDNEPVAFEVAVNSSLIQPSAGAGNQVNGDFSASSGSHVFLQQIAISSGFFEIYDSSGVIMEPSTPGGIVLNVTGGFELGAGGSLDMGDDGTPVTINSGGVAGTMRLLDHASVLVFGGSVINMDVELFRASSIDGGDNAKIGGNLGVHGFSSYVMTGQVGTSVGGTVSCFKGEAFEFLASDPTTPIALGSCL